MILTAGLTPAWQQIMRFGRLDIGGVNRAAEVHWCASGKAINAGIALASLGVPAHTLSPAGGLTGQAMRVECAANGLAATWVATQTPTRVCTTLLNDADGSATELVENAAPLTDAELNDFRARFRDLASRSQFVVLTGSLPKGTPTTFYADLLEHTACPILLDVRGAELLAALPRRPRVVKPNREELAMTFGRALPDRAALLSAMRELIDLGAQSVVITHGKSAVLVMEGSQVHELTPPTVTPVVNPIGCGDCVAAGIAWGLSRGDCLVDAVRLGLAMAADNVTQLLPARLSGERVARFRA